MTKGNLMRRPKRPDWRYGMMVRHAYTGRQLTVVSSGDKGIRCRWRDEHGQDEKTFAASELQRVTPV